MARHRIIVGVDPDAEASGIAVLDTATRSMSLCCLPFPEAVAYIRSVAAKSPGTLGVYVEAGWLNAGNWHVRRGDGPAKAAAMGASVGRNQETGRKLIEMLSYYGVPCCTYRPLKKCWKGKDGKISHDEFKAVTGVKNGRTNQEERDAGLIAWCAAELPIVIHANAMKNGTTSQPRRL